MRAGGRSKTGTTGNSVPTWEKTTLDNFAHMAAETGNCLYIWQAIDFCIDRQIDLPPFCRKYLGEAAAKIVGLLGDATIGTLHDIDGKRRSPNLDTGDMVTSVSKILGFVLHKDNAFRRAQAEFNKRHAALQEQVSNELGMPADFAQRDTRLALSERQISRRTRGGRKLLGRKEET